MLRKKSKTPFKIIQTFIPSCFVTVIFLWTILSLQILEWLLRFVWFLALKGNLSVTEILVSSKRLVVCFLYFSDNKSAIFILWYLLDGITWPELDLQFGRDRNQAENVTMKKTRQVRTVFTYKNSPRVPKPKSPERQLLPLGGLLNDVEKATQPLVSPK